MNVQVITLAMDALSRELDGDSSYSDRETMSKQERENFQYAAGYLIGSLGNTLANLTIRHEKKSETPAESD